MDFSIPLAAGQSVLLIHFGPDGAETKQTLSYLDRFNSCVGSTGVVCIIASSKLGTICTFLTLLLMFCCIYYNCDT